MLVELDHRENQVLQARLADLPTYKIAKQLHMAVRTVKRITQTLCAKFGVANADQLFLLHQPGSVVWALTWRQNQVLRLVLEGKTNSAIAEELYTSPTRIVSDLAKVYQILAIPNRQALLQLCKGLASTDAMLEFLDQRYLQLKEQQNAS